jgi:hypothetical protein
MRGLAPREASLPRRRGSSPSFPLGCSLEVDAEWPLSPIRCFPPHPGAFSAQSLRISLAHPPSLVAGRQRLWHRLWAPVQRFRVWVRCAVAASRRPRSTNGESRSFIRGNPGEFRSSIVRLSLTVKCVPLSIREGRLSLPRVAASPPSTHVSFPNPRSLAGWLARRLCRC